MELRPEHNCWRTTRIERGGFLLSGQSYFRAFRKMVIGAERYVYVLAWDLSEKIETVRDADYDDGYPSGLADFVFAVLEDKPELEIYILLWDYSMVYAAEREWLPLTRWRKEGHSRLHFAVDDAISGGASHHQKVIVMDDALALCGGFDLSAWRWDTTEHLAKDPRRVTPKGDPFQPYHEMEIVVSGPAAKDLGELCAIRWERATGERLPRPEQRRGPLPWPEEMEIPFEGEDAAIALTFSRYKEYAPSRHIERLHLDLIAEAEDYLYIENQYLSSHTIVEALAGRLREEAGPEVIIVLTRDTGGWLEEGTMGVLRDRLLEILSEADAHGRFRAYFPFVEDEEGNESQVYVHAKLLIADDRMVEIGSANLSNRSMKVDSEADVVMVKEKPAAFIRDLLHRLLGIHFRMPADEVASHRRETASLGRAIESIRDGRRHRLEPLPSGCNNMFQRKLANTQLLDPDEPISPSYWIRETLRRAEADAGPARSRWRIRLEVGAWLVAGILLAYSVKEAWGGAIDKDSVVAYLEGVRSHPYVILILLAVFFVAGLIAVPINLLLVAGTIVLGPPAAYGCGLVGALASAAAGFGVGHWLGKPLIRLLASERLERLAEKIGDRGPLSVALIRIVPIAPFNVINFVAGFSRLRLSTFMTGSVMGMMPGMLAVVLVTHQVQSVVTRPNWQTWVGLVAVLLLVGGVAARVRRNFNRGKGPLK